MALAATSPSHWREVWESGSSLVITHLLLPADRDGEISQLGVANEIALPQGEQFPRFHAGQWSPALQIVLVAREVEVELLAELGILAQSLITEVGDVIEITLGSKSVKVKVTEVKEVVRKEDAATMYEAAV